MTWYSIAWLYLAPQAFGGGCALVCFDLVSERFLLNPSNSSSPLYDWPFNYSAQLSLPHFRNEASFWCSSAFEPSRSWLLWHLALIVFQEISENCFSTFEIIFLRHLCVVLCSCVVCIVNTVNALSIGLANSSGGLRLARRESQVMKALPSFTSTASNSEWPKVFFCPLYSVLSILLFSK